MEHQQVIAGWNASRSDQLQFSGTDHGSSQELLSQKVIKFNCDLPALAFTTELNGDAIARRSYLESAWELVGPFGDVSEFADRSAVHAAIDRLGKRCCCRQHRFGATGEEFHIDGAYFIGSKM